jgi:dCMP deaminase
MSKAIHGMRILPTYLLNKEAIERFSRAEGLEIVMPTEDITIAFNRRYLPNQRISYESYFLRWDKWASTKEQPVSPDRTISEDQLDLEFMLEAKRESAKSSDWWRQVGALAARDGSILLTGFNHHLPHEQNPYVLGDLRHNFNAGEHLDVSTAIHAEAAVIAAAAKKGRALEGASMYVTTFPCPGCARSIFEAGIRKVYYREGYSRVDAEEIFKTAQIEIILVK